MTNKTNINWASLSDAAIAESLGEFIRHHRLEQNKTQSQLAREAGINRSTLVEFEKGTPTNIMTLIRLLRVLNLFHVLDQFKVTQQISPIQLAELEQSKRKRASKAKKTSKKKKSDW